MRTLTTAWPSLTCVGGMALCMWLMSRSHRPGSARGAEVPGVGPASSAEVAQLGDEVARLRAELDGRASGRTP